MTTRPAWPAEGSTTYVTETAAVIDDAQGTLDAYAQAVSDPNLGLARLLPAPREMASPPTITAGSADGSTTISNSVLYGPGGNTAEVFSFFGCPAELGSAFPADQFYSPTNAVTNGTVNVGHSFAVEFEWYGQEFELLIKGTDSGYLLMVDGEYDTRAGRSDAPSDGSFYLIDYDFGTAGFRRIRFEFSGSLFFGGIRIEPTATIWKSSSPRGPKVVVTGDSFTEEFTHWPQMMSWRLGWRDVSIVGAGSTGYLDTNTGQGWGTYRQRAQKDIYDQSPDIVIVSGGLNDNGNTYENILAEATTLFAEIKEELPDALLIVSGAQYVFGGGDAAYIPIRDAIRQAADDVGVDLYIEQIGGPFPYDGTASHYNNTGWITGSGKIDNPQNDGNSDIFRGADGTHPTQLGHDYRGLRHAEAIAAAMPIIGN